MKYQILVIQLKKTDYDTKVKKIEKQITDHSHNKYITTPEHNKLTTKPELRFCAGSNPACGMLEIRDGEDL